MSFLFAFITCGFLCALAEGLSQAGLIPPVILNVFLGAGGVLTPCGIMGALSAFGCGGFLVVICGAGNAFETAAELTVAGIPTPLILVSLLFLFVILAGIAAGEVRYRALSENTKPRQKQKQTQQSQTYTD